MNVFSLSLAERAVLALADIKANAAAFDRGDANIVDALEAIATTCEAYLAVTQKLRPAA
jgi:hypothetical protein